MSEFDREGRGGRGGGAGKDKAGEKGGRRPFFRRLFQ